MKRRTLSLVAIVTVVCIFSLVLSVAAQRQPEQSSNQPAGSATNSVANSRSQQKRRPQRMEDFDIRANLDRTLPARAETANEPPSRYVAAARNSRLRGERPSVQMSFSSLTGAPSRVFSFAQDLTQATGADAEITARQFLKRNDDLFRLRTDEVEALRTARRYRTEHNGVTHLTLQQQVNNIEVFQGDYSFHLDRNGAIIAAGGELLPGATRLVNAARPRLAAAAALRKAVEYADAEFVNEPAIKSQAAGNEQRQKLADAALFARDVDARLVYFPLTGDELRLAWEFTMWMQQTPDVYLMVVDAENGALLYRDNQTWYCFEDGTVPGATGSALSGTVPGATGSALISTISVNHAATRSLPLPVLYQAQGPHGLVFTQESPRPNWPFAGNNPPFVQREDLPFRATPYFGTAIFPASDPHNDWWAGQSPTSFTSNNADAYLDRDANNQPDDAPRLAVADSNFSFPIDFAQQPDTTDNQKAAVANLFYWVNRYHDILYSFGFDEGAGNYQSNNFGKPGLGGDLIRAEAQDGSGTNNANFSPSPDGSPGRTQMYLFTGGAIRRDGDLDQGIILHELTHGTSTRLVRNLGGTQGGGMGEGWSDYFGLALILKEGDDLDGNYAVGGFALNDFVNGVRRFPYSTSASVYPYNFGDITKSTEIHAVGEIWCNALMEMRAALIRKLGFKEGQRQSLQLVVDGMKLSPPAPTFVDARNAILRADKTNNQGANQCTMWQAFAKRGLGFSASTLSASDGAPQQEFDIPASCSDLGSVRFNQKTYLSGETISFTINDRNASDPVRVKVRSSVTGDEETVTTTPDGTFAGAFNASLRFVAGPAAPGDGVLQASLASRDKIIVTYEDANNGNGTAATITGQAEVAGEKIFFDDMVEAGNQGWIVTGTPANTWAITDAKAASGSRSWTDSPNGNYAARTDASLVSPLFDLTRAAGVTMTFAHSYAFTNGADYGFVEYSLDDGATWKRAAAFTGSQPSFAQAVVKLDVLAGEAKARLRFRLNSTSTTTADGWTIDDIRIIARSSDPAFIPAPSSLGPMLAGVLPASGVPAGSTAVTITGLNFTETGDVRVFFNGAAAPNVRALGSSTITATTPALGPGKASVRVETRYGAVTLANAFTYYVNGSTVGAPDIVSITPPAGSIRGGTVVTINGSNFSPETTVLFGALTATKTFINSNTLRVATPAVAVTGAVDVTARNSATAEKKIVAGFSYVAPTPPTVRVLTPGGGESFFVGSTVTLRWQSSDNRRVARHRVALYRSTATTPQLVANIADLGGDAQSFNWTIPPVTVTNVARIRVLATDDEGADAETFSGSDFTINTRWEAIAQIPTAVERTLAVSDGKYVYSIAGRRAADSTTSISAVQRLDPAAASPVWEQLAPLPIAMNGAKAVALNGKLYVPGGFNITPDLERNHYVYDIAANTWATLASPLRSVLLYSLATNNNDGVFYLTGGTESSSAPGSGAVTNAQAYDTRANTWSALPPMTAARAGHESVLVAGKLYVAGGAGPIGTLTSGEVFDFSTQKWSAIAPMPRARQYAASALARNAEGRLLWLIFGGEDGATVLNSADAYDIAADRWLTLDGSFNLPSARSRLGGATLGGFIYALGGSSGSTSVRTAERFKLDGFTIISPNLPPLMTVPVTQQIALPNRELTFVVSAQDLGSGVPIIITAEGLPGGAAFNVVNDTNNSARGTFRWTPSGGDVGRSFNISFTATDGFLSDVKAVQVSVVQASQVAAVNAADFRVAPLAADSIAAAFGTGLSPRVELAQSMPLPTTLADTTLTVNGIPAPLFFVSPTQINFVVPAGVDLGSATILVSTQIGQTGALGSFALGNIEIVAAAPAIFTANASGRGDAAAQATIDGVNYQQPPFDVTVNGRPNVLVLYATGIRRTPAANPNDSNGVAESVTVTIDGQTAKVLYAGAQGSFAGLDQINVEFPASLANQGQRRVEVVVTAGGAAANRVTIQIK